MENTRASASQHSTKPKLKDIWSAQCGTCFKWRRIPTKEEYEEIRSKFIDDPFVCSKQGITCDHPSDLEYDNSRTWVIDKPNIPKPPPGFTRRVVMRKGFAKMDCYYDTPNGKTLRSSKDVRKFLRKNPEYREGTTTSAEDFSFTCPKIMGDTIPNIAKE